MSILVNKDKDITVEISLAPKGKCNYFFKEGNRKMKRFLSKDQPLDLGQRTDLYKYFRDKSGDERLIIKNGEVVFNEEFFIKLQDKYDKLINEQEEALSNAAKVEHDEDAARFWEYHIHKFGLIPVLSAYLDYVHIGDHTNIYQKILHGFEVICGEESYYQQTTARAEAGKSYEDELFISLFPQEHVLKLNGITAAAFRNLCIAEPKMFNCKLVYAGDKGEEIDQELMKELKTIIKQLITDGYYTYTKDDGHGQSVSVKIVMISDGLAWIENTVLNNRKNDQFQESSRTMYYTIREAKNERQVLDFIAELRVNRDGKVYNDYTEARKKLDSFQHFLRMKKEQHRQIFVPMEYRTILRERLINNPTKRREYDRYLAGLQAFMELQSNEDVVDKSTFEEYCKYFLNETSMDPLTNNLYLALADLLTPLTFDEVEDLLDNSVVASHISHQEYDEYEKQNRPVVLESFHDIQEKNHLDIVLRKLLDLYRLKNNNGIRCFFTLSDLRYSLKCNSAYKNITDINSALETMKDYGFIDCLEEQVKINGHNYKIWYLVD